MYYYPIASTPAADRDNGARFESPFNVLVEGVAAQQRLQLEAMTEIVLAPLRNAGTLAAATNAAEFAVYSLAAGTGIYARLVELSHRALHVAGSTGREFQEVLRRHAPRGTARTAAGADGERPQPESPGGQANPGASAPWQLGQEPGTAAQSGPRSRGHESSEEPPVHRVLIPVDGSEGALRAAAHLIGLVYHGAPPEVHVLNVQPPIMSGDVSSTVTAEMVKRGRFAAGEEVLQRARGLFDRIGIPYVTSVLLGAPAETIVRYVEDHRIDGIVMGTRGMSALKNFLLGSVAAKVVGMAEVPVTLVK